MIVTDQNILESSLFIIMINYSVQARGGGVVVNDRSNVDGVSGQSPSMGDLSSDFYFFINYYSKYQNTAFSLLN